MSRILRTCPCHGRMVSSTSRAAFAQVKPVVAAVALRKPFWFEKFCWFVTSDNLLVVSGRDAQQNELLVKRYLRKEDLYVHADLHGAATTILRNDTPGRPGAPVALSSGLVPGSPRAF